MKARIPKHREFIIDFPQDMDQAKADEGWNKLNEIVEEYKKAHNGQSVYSATFIEDCEPAVKKLQEEYTHVGEGEDKMAAKTVIRPAAEADIPAILALYRQLDSALVAMQPEFFCEGPREEDEIRKAIRADDADFLLAERGGAVVGFALVGYAGWTPEFSCVLPHRYARLEDLAVDEAVRGQGVGNELLAAAKRWARNRRLEYLELNVLAQNENAIRLYESQDFVEATKVMRCML